MPQPTLRELARKYADGTLAKAAYRQSRAELLRGILSGKIALRVNEYRPPVAAPGQDELEKREEHSDITQFSAGAPAAPPTPAASAPTPAPAAPKAANTASAKPRSTFPRLIVIGATLGLLGLAVLAAMLLPDARQSEPVQDSAGTAAASAQPDTAGNVAPGPAQRLIQEFLEQKDWSDSGLNSFTLQWQQLTPAEQTAAEGSMQLSQLKNTIYKKLLEERALSGLDDDGQALSRQRRLIRFAENIGINDSRLRLAGAAKS